MNTFSLYIYSLIIIIYLLYIIYLLPYYLTIYQYFMRVVSYYFSRFIFLPYYFFGKIHLCSIFLYRFCTGFSAKIGKNLPIFCNFFSLCINYLRKS